MKARSRLLALGLALAQSAAAESPAKPREDAPVLAPRQLLDRAFDARYADTMAEVEIRIDDGHGGVHERQLSIVTKEIGGRMHSLGRLRSPEYLRGMSLLNIEREDGGEDSFVFMPALGRVRRISSAQRSDSFLGSDLTFEDFQRLRAGDFQVVLLGREDVAGEVAWRLQARCEDEAQYERMELAVAASDHAVLEVRYYAKAASEPYRVVETPRAHLVRGEGGSVVPGRLVVRNLQRGSRTEVTLRDLKVDPEIDDHLFSVGALQREVDLRTVAP